MKKDHFFIIITIIFGIVALIHLMRIVGNWSVQIHTWNIPIAASFAGAVIAAYLALTAYALSKKR